MKAFITGSHAYGTPTEYSDVDLGIAVSKEDYALLWKLKDKNRKGLRFGPLNIVAFNIDDEEALLRFIRWRNTNDKLIARKPVTKEEACAAFLAAGANIVYNQEPTQTIAITPVDDETIPF